MSNSTTSVGRNLTGRSIGIRGLQGILGYDAPIGPQGEILTGYPGDQGNPGPTCACRLDTDLDDVGATGDVEDGDYLIYSNSKFRLNQITDINQVDFSNIPEFTSATGALESLGSYRLWKSDERIRLTPPLFALAYWNFEEGSGTNLADTGKPAGDNDATINVSTTNVDFTTGKLGDWALDFKVNAVDRVTAPDEGLPTNAVSFSLWFKTTLTGNQILFFYGVDGDGGSPGFGRSARMLQKSSSNIFWGSDKGSTWFRKSIASMSDGNWHHIVCTYDGTDNLSTSLGLYFDGVSQTADTLPTESLTPVDFSDYCVFGNGSGGRNEFPGQMDDVAVFGQVLTPQQVEYLYNEGNGRPARFVPVYS